MPYWFEPPTRELLRNYQAEPDRVYPVEGAARALFRYIKRGGSGLSVLKKSGVYVTKEFPSQDECDAADLVYLGGHRYLVDADEAAALSTAGFDVEGYTPISTSWDDLAVQYTSWDDLAASVSSWDDIQ